MEIKEVNYSTEEGVTAGTVEVVPSAEGGVFVSNPSDGIRAVGSSALIVGINSLEHLEELEAGNKSVLARYVMMNLVEEGSYKIADGCEGYIETSETTSVVANGGIREFAPLDSHLASFIREAFHAEA